MSQARKATTGNKYAVVVSQWPPCAISPISYTLSHVLADRLIELPSF
jgi:hypothetical protein